MKLKKTFNEAMIVAMILSTLPKSYQQWTYFIFQQKTKLNKLEMQLTNISTYKKKFLIS